jgi:hypothetical protein
MLNFPERDCLRRDFNPRIMNTFADPALVEEVLSQEDYTSFARAIEKVRSFDQPNIHGSGHFGVGGVLGTIGNAANSPGGMALECKYEYILTYYRSVVLPASRKSRSRALEMAAKGSGKSIK